MTPYDLEAVRAQLAAIIERRQPTPLDTGDDRIAEEVQRMLLYLGRCLWELEDFAGHLSAGNLDREPPSRQNLFAGELKELHSGLLHLTWQASQVAKGDYHQRVDFMGEFSKSFNRMVEQLEERETSLREKAETLSQSTSLLESIVDGLTEWLVVVEEKRGQILYLNRSARREMVFLSKNLPACAQDCGILEHLLHYKREKNGRHKEFYCRGKGKLLAVDSFPIKWRGAAAYAHLVSDITDTKRTETLAYADELTGLGNRWHAMKLLGELVEKKEAFLLCYVDLDGLKYVNDRFGHATGDYYLRRAAECLKTASLPGEQLCRIGGDEFLIMAPGEERTGLERRLDAACKALAMGPGDYPKSFSRGIIQVEAGSSRTCSQLLDAADKLMYRDKRQRKKARDSE